MIRNVPRADPRLRDVVWLAIGVGGGVMCITLLFLGMRAVMDIGGACAEGGPYVPVQPCPDGAPAAMFIGGFGLFLFGAIAMVGGGRVGSPWGAMPLLGWCALFGALGWNFLDYGLLNPPEGQGIELGFLVPGVLFEAMAIVPLAFVAWALWSAMRSVRARGPVTGRSTPPPVPEAYRRERTAAVSPSFAAREAREAAAVTPSGSASPPTPETARRAELRAIDALMGAAIAGAVADAPVDPRARSVMAGPEPAGSSGTLAEEAFPEGTQALLDRLERLADMRDRGLLAEDEYETAKAAVVRELEARE